MIVPAGYDLEGASDKSMKWRLVGTRKFIGTSGETLTSKEFKALLLRNIHQIFRLLLRPVAYRSYSFIAYEYKFPC